MLPRPGLAKKSAGGRQYSTQAKQSGTKLLSLHFSISSSGQSGFTQPVTAALRCRQSRATMSVAGSLPASSAGRSRGHPRATPSAHSRAWIGGTTTILPNDLLQRGITNGFAFVINIKRIQEPSLELAPGFLLRKATPAERPIITEIIESMPSTGHPLEEFFWQRPLPLNAGLLAPSAQAEDWRYFVIEFQSRRIDTIFELQQALDLSPTELDIGFALSPNPAPTYPSASYSFSRVYQFLQSATWASDPLVEVGQSVADEIRGAHALLQSARSHPLFPRRQISQMGELKDLPESSPLRFLGFFSILESLLTHPPIPTDPYDSITRQVTTKLKLLNARFDRPLDYTPFGGMGSDKTWKKMYKYRSLIAHGGTANFSKDPELKPLKDEGTALELLKTATKTVILEALKEPQLIADLQQC